MTAKQLLHDFVDRLSEDDAAITAAMLIPSASRSLRDDERAAIERGLAEADAGELISLEDVERDFGLNSLKEVGSIFRLTRLFAPLARDAGVGRGVGGEGRTAANYRGFLSGY